MERSARTPEGFTPVRPWKLRLDWSAWQMRQDGYPGWEDAEVEVWLEVMGEEPVLLREFWTPGEAASFGRQFIHGRGFMLYADPDRAQREGHTYLVLHPGPPLGR